MEQTISECRFNRPVAPGYYRMGISCPEAYSKSIPGQFVMVGLPEATVPLLRRPFSIHGLIKSGERVEGIEILYKVVGPATRRLATCGKGEPLSLLGPLGRGFTLSDKYRKIVIVAGGIGVAPLLFLAAKLKESGADPTLWKVFLGGRSEADILCLEDFSALGCPVHITTDDGSLGDQCLVTHPVEEALSAELPDIMYACGPDAMMQCIAGYAAKHRVHCQVSVETMMACGVGACLGCAVQHPQDSSRYHHVCKDGPVFESHLIY
jgi:dihydroorotate dehydrogenase electron transfer subunit